MSMQIPFVGFQPIRTSEHMAALGYYNPFFLKKTPGEKSSNFYSFCRGVRIDDRSFGFEIPQLENNKSRIYVFIQIGNGLRGIRRISNCCYSHV